MAKSRINRGRSRREELRQDAAHRAEARANRSNSEQIELLDSRLGKGAGASRERERLASVLEKETQEKSEKKSRPKSTGKKGKQKREARANKK